MPGAGAIIRDEVGRILLQQRGDTCDWSLPAGAMEIGERVDQTIIREVREETGLEVKPTRLVGIYSDQTFASRIQAATRSKPSAHSLNVTSSAVNCKPTASNPCGWISFLRMYCRPCCRVMPAACVIHWRIGPKPSFGEHPMQDLHPWTLDPAEAIQIQTALRERLTLEWDGRAMSTIGGVDIGLEQDTAARPSSSCAIPTSHRLKA